MKWGVRRYQPYGKGGYSPKKKSVFISGSSKTQDKESSFYRSKLPSEIRTQINKNIKGGNRFLVGDAPGIDSQVQDYLKRKKYGEVTVYTVSERPRYIADKSWNVKRIKSNNTEGSKEWLRDKDIAMTNDADKGIAVLLPGGSRATRNNVQRLMNQNKDVFIYELGSSRDRIVTAKEFISELLDNNSEKLNKR